jgi:hypothetical protein
MGLEYPQTVWMPGQLRECWKEPFLRAWFEETDFLERTIRRETKWWQMIQNGGLLIKYRGRKVLAEVVKSYFKILEQLPIASSECDAQSLRSVLKVLESWGYPALPSSNQLGCDYN